MLRQNLCLSQPDGTTLLVQAYGDENISFLADARTGDLLTCDSLSGFWRTMTDQEVSVALQQWNAAQRRAALEHVASVPSRSVAADSEGAGASANGPRKLGGTKTSGDISLPVLLVQFSDLAFSEQYGSVAHFDSILNSDTYCEKVYETNGKEYYARSARNYFRTQSNDLFRPTFDLIGPVTLSKSYQYYGQNSSSQKDVHWKDMVSEALNLAISQGLISTTSQWDGDGNGMVDLIYVIYAGWPESQKTTDSYTLWPKNGSFGQLKAPDGNYFKQASISSELMWNTSAGYDDTNLKDDGIGTLVHEFCHALGLPDFYDTFYQGTCYGMDVWSIMDQGLYSGLHHIPSSMTVHERLQLGWLEPEVWPTNDTTLTLLPFSTSLQSYMLYNPQDSDEYVTFENHQHDGNWDECWGGGSYTLEPTTSGLLVTHVDYDATLWSINMPNNTASHQHCTPLCADGTRDPYKSSFTAQERQAFLTSLYGDIFPGNAGVTSLDSSHALAQWYTGEPMDLHITNIVQMADGSMQISIANTDSSSIEDLEDKELSVASANARRSIELRNGRLVVKGFDLLGRKIDFKF